MRKLLLIVGLALLLLGGALGLLAAGVRLAWQEVPPPGGAGFLANLWLSSAVFLKQMT